MNIGSRPNNISCCLKTSITYYTNITHVIIIKHVATSSILNNLTSSNNQYCFPLKIIRINWHRFISLTQWNNNDSRANLHYWKQKCKHAHVYSHHMLYNISRWVHYCMPRPVTILHVHTSTWSAPFISGILGIHRPVL